MTKMAAMPIYGKNLKKIFFSRTNLPMILKFICSIVYVALCILNSVRSRDLKFSQQIGDYKSAD